VLLRSVLLIQGNMTITGLQGLIKQKFYVSAQRKHIESDTVTRKPSLQSQTSNIEMKFMVH
jgi:hypothetical protein